MRNEIQLKYTMMKCEEKDTAEIMVYGDIMQDKWTESDMTAMDFDKLLKDAKASGARRLNLRINSGGGAVYQAVAMRTMLMGSGFEEIGVKIEGLCASAATLLTCIPNAKVSIAEGSEFMIHNPSTITWGTAADFEKTADRLHKMESDFHGIYAARTGKCEEEIKDMMDAETWMTAREAVENGFCDTLIEEEAIAAYCSEDMKKIRAMYRHMPEDIIVREDDAHDDSNADTELSAGEASVYNNDTEEETVMEIKDLTIEQLQAENSALYASVMNAGAAAERERISEIDDLTPAGYEEMAAEAKANGTSAMDFHKQIVKAQREKGKEFLANRKTETAPAANITGGAAEDDVKNDADAEEKAAKEIAEFAKMMRVGGDSMY